MTNATVATAPYIPGIFKIAFPKRIRTHVIIHMTIIISGAYLAHLQIYPNGHGVAILFFQTQKIFVPP